MFSLLFGAKCIDIFLGGAVIPKSTDATCTNDFSISSHQEHPRLASTGLYMLSPD